MTSIDQVAGRDLLATVDTFEYLMGNTPKMVSTPRFEASLDKTMSLTDQMKRYVGSLKVDDRILTTGSVRERDADIFRLIENKIAQHDLQNGPLRVLEVGSGVSLPLVAGIEGENSLGDEGAPWFSRALKEHFGDKIEVTASDLQHEKFQVSLNLFLDGELYLSCAATPHIEMPENFDSPLPYEAYAMSLPSFDAQLLSIGRAPLQAINLSKAVDGYSLDRIKQASSSIGLNLDDPRIEFSLLPLIQVQMESDIFRIKYQPGVDLLALGNTFEPNSFDVVFGRHLFPVLEEERDRLANIGESIRSVLKNEGISFLQFDLSPEPLVISHEMKTF